MWGELESEHVFAFYQHGIAYGHFFSRFANEAATEYFKAEISFVKRSCKRLQQRKQFEDFVAYDVTVFSIFYSTFWLVGLDN